MKRILAIIMLAITAGAADIVLYSTVAPTSSTCGIPKTGVTNSYNVGDDGYYQAGVALPNPLWEIVGADGTDETNQVRHIPSGLIFARDIDGLIPATNYVDALTLCEALVYGGASDWRMPNINEMTLALAWNYSQPALTDLSGTAQWTQGNPWFIGVVASTRYSWSSTPYAANVVNRWHIGTRYGAINIANTNNLYYCWPVRGP